MSYESMVNKLIGKKIRKYIYGRGSNGHKGIAEYDYYDPDKEEIAVSWYTKHGNLIKTKTYSKKKIREMYDSL